mmetsp:Transcript_26397/g.48252  ORF Transcript_26397/g.48252 Transcript_26397/m.48252 type:complete len:268 (+) Transcript_26397:89-892(+)
MEDDEDPRPPNIPEVPWPIHVAPGGQRASSSRTAALPWYPPPPPEYPIWVRPYCPEAPQFPPDFATQGAGKGRSKRRRGKGRGGEATSPHRGSPQPHRMQVGHGLLSRGSKNHMRGHCHPCLVYFTLQGCPEGAMCNFCHYPHDEARLQEVRSTAFERAQQRRQTTRVVEQAAGEGQAASVPGEIEGGQPSAAAYPSWASGSSDVSLQVPGSGEQLAQAQHLRGLLDAGLQREQHGQSQQGEGQQEEGDETPVLGLSGQWRAVRLSL